MYFLVIMGQNNKIIRDICLQFIIKQIFVTIHHPASNGLVDLTNRKILEILRRFQESLESWLSHVAVCIKNSVISFTDEDPHYILFGYDQRLP